MVALQLKKVILKKLISNFELKENEELEVQNRSSLKINLSDDKKTCFASFSNQTVATENPDVFNIELEFYGMFSCDGINSKEDKQFAHVQIYNYLFPYVQSLVAEICVKAGMPALMLNSANIDPSTVDVDVDE